MKQEFVVDSASYQVQFHILHHSKWWSVCLSVCLSVHRLEDYVIKEVIVAEEKQVRQYNISDSISTLHSEANVISMPALRLWRYCNNYLWHCSQGSPGNNVTLFYEITVFLTHVTRQQVSIITSNLGANTSCVDYEWCSLIGQILADELA